MIAVNSSRQEVPATWQNAFVKILPDIQQRLRHAFRHLDAESRDDATAEAVIHALLSYVRLFQRGRSDSVSASSLAWYAAKQVKRGRPAAGPMNVHEPLSRYAQLSKGIHVQRLHTGNKSNDQWIDRIVEDKRASVVDQVAVRLDAREWFATLPRRMKGIAKDLAHGFSTSEVARKHGVTAGRISQLRRELYDAWRVFQGELTPAQL
jgi:hypothetical protein